MYPSIKGESSEVTPPPPVPATGIPVGMVYPPSAPPMAGGPSVVPPPAALPQLQPWTTGLCDCCDDCYSCCLTCWCPCIAFGHIAEIIDKGKPSCCLSGALYCVLQYFTLGLCQCFYSCTYRSKLRAAYGLPETPCPDCLVHCCCEACALCQMHRELKNRGLDPALVSEVWFCE